jgi:hypothetical protein
MTEESERSLLVCDVTQRGFVVSYRLHGGTYRFLLGFLALEDGTDMLSRKFGNYEHAHRKIPDKVISNLHRASLF